MKTAQVTWHKKKVLGLRLRTWFLFLFVAPFLVWGGLNALFSSSFGTGMLERKIEGKIGLPSGIGSVTWSPWAGITVKDFDIFAPDGFEESPRILHVGLIEVDPAWTLLLRGEKRFERIEIDGLIGELSFEQLKEILSRYHRQKPVEVVHPKPQKQAPVVEAETAPMVPEGEEGQPVVPKITPKVEPKIEDGPTELAENVLVDDFEATLVLRDASLSFYSEEQPDFKVSLSELGAEIPIWGKAREGEIRPGNLEVGNYLADLKKTWPVKWNGQAIQLEKNAMKLLGVNLELTAEVRMVAGIPFGMRLNLPDQGMDLSPIYPESKTPIEVAHLSSFNVLQGYLLSPASFTGQSVTKFTNLIIHDPRDGGDINFDHGSAVVRLSSSGIVADDIRAIGDEDSVLMNGFATTGGIAAATVRIVSSPERAESHEKRIRSSALSLSMEFRPLVTPDREYRDIRIEARPGGLAMDIGVDEQWVPFFPTARAILGDSNSTSPRLP